MSKVVDVVSNSNDALGTTVGAKKDGKYSAAVLSAFGETLETLQCEATSNFKHQTSNSQTFFTGKPFVERLGHAFWMRNYRAGLAKWQSADPMGYPDGWNQLAYCNNGVTSAVDLWGCATTSNLEPRELGTVVIGEKKDLRSVKDGDPRWEVYPGDGKLHLMQYYTIIDDTVYAKKYRRVKQVPRYEWLHEIADGCETVGEYTMALGAAVALLPDPFPPSKISELLSAPAITGVGAVEWAIGKVLSCFDEQIIVWDGPEFLGVPYKRKIDFQPIYIIE